MGQIFSPKSNAIAKLSLWLVLVAGLGGMGVAFGWLRTDYVTGRDDTMEQPVPFSHKHHVQGLGLDCRFCHVTVERGAFAGVPDTQTCMTCHSEVWKESAMLKPVRDSFQSQTPLKWYKIYRLPGYVYFDHSIHVAKGVGCVSCHGEVSEMPRIRQTRSFLMKDCLECHEHPEANLRPVSELTNEAFQIPSDSAARFEIMHANHAQVQNITDCSRCHR